MVLIYDFDSQKDNIPLEGALILYLIKNWEFWKTCFKLLVGHLYESKLLFIYFLIYFVLKLSVRISYNDT